MKVTWAGPPAAEPQKTGQPVEWLSAVLEKVEAPAARSPPSSKGLREAAPQELECASVP